MIEPGEARISVARQCALLDLNRSSYYYEAQVESAENLSLMRQIDELHLKYPFYGSPRMTLALSALMDKAINEKRVARLMRQMRIRSVLPKPKTTQVERGHKTYPYLLRDLKVERVNQVWATDITYLPLARGFMYLTAVIDWYSRYVLAWELSNSMEVGFCVDALKSALVKGTPEIFNTDQGSQFTSTDFTKVLLDKGIAISMDGKGRALDNIFTERLWWSVKYEEVYLNAYQDGTQLWQALNRYFNFYNYQRPHQSLDYQFPAKVFGLIG